MPKPVYAKSETQILAEQRAEFACRGTWRRVGSGNLWRTWEGTNITIFKRSDGTFNWCVSGENGPSYSTTSYPTENQAIESLCLELIG
jgi:hypothetical protein